MAGLQLDDLPGDTGEQVSRQEDIHSKQVTRLDDIPGDQVSRLEDLTSDTCE